MSRTANLSLPFLVAAQAQKHVTVNEGLLRLDALAQIHAESATTTTQPVSPIDEQLFVLPAGKSGDDWSAMADGALAYYRDGAWEEITPREGWIAWLRDTDELRVYDGAAWSGAFAREDAANVFTQTQEITDGAGGAIVLGASNGAYTATRAVDGSGGLSFIMRRSRGAIGSETQLNGGDDIAQFAFQARTNGGSYTTTARVLAEAAEAHGASALGTRLVFSTVLNGATSETTEATLQGGLLMAGATGGAKDVGTINATAVYDDNVLLTCGPVELMREGGVDLAKWDALAPRGRHDVMHRFADMQAEGFDPRDPENFCARMRADGAVPGLFTEGEWGELCLEGRKPDIGAATTRIFLALDNLAVAFDAMMKRIAAIETKLAG